MPRAIAAPLSVASAIACAIARSAHFTSAVAVSFIDAKRRSASIRVARGEDGECVHTEEAQSMHTPNKTKCNP